MPMLHTQFYVPNEIFQKLHTGELRRFGAVIRNRKGQIVAFLDEFDVTAKDALKNTALAVIEEVKANKKMVAIVVGVTAGVSVVSAVVLYKVNKKRIAKRQELTAEFEDALLAYFQAIGSQALTDAVLDRLLGAIKAVRGSEICKGRSGRELVSLLSVFSKGVEDYARELCKDTGKKFKEVKTKKNAASKLDTMYDYLELQREMLNRAA